MKHFSTNDELFKALLNGCPFKIGQGRWGGEQSLPSLEERRAEMLENKQIYEEKKKLLIAKKEGNTDKIKRLEQQAILRKRKYQEIAKQLREEKEVEIERLHQAKARATKDAGLEETADGAVEEYRGRAWTRIEMLEDRLEQVRV